MRKTGREYDRVKKNLIVVALSLLVWNMAEAQRAVPMNLRTMVAQAGTIVHATGTDTRTGRDPVTGMPATWVTLEVGENFFGASGPTVTFKQVGGEANGMAYRPADVPRYTLHEEIVLLLYPEHPRTGFRSPVGLGQGKFVVRTGPAPRKKVVEQVTRSPHLMKADITNSDASVLSFDELAGEIRSLVRAEKGGHQ